MVQLLFGIVLTGVFLLPIVWLVAGSLWPGSEIFTSLDPLFRWQFHSVTADAGKFWQRAQRTRSSWPHERWSWDCWCA